MKQAPHDEVVSAEPVMSDVAHVEFGPANCESHAGIPKVFQHEGLVVADGSVQLTVCCC